MPTLKTVTFEAGLVEEWRRRAYLHAMGVRVWELRSPEAIGHLVPAGLEDQSASMEVPETVADVSAVNEPAPVSAGEALSDVASAAPMPLGEPSELPVWSDDWDAYAAMASESDGMPQPQPSAASLVSDMDWEALEDAVAQCRACGLCETRTQTVFGVGDRGAELMVVGEAPGADEDREGEPFVGRAGRLLNRMLEAIGLRREQVYIANVLKCRPPGNRDPKPEEAAQCEAFLMRQIALVRPKVILSVGRISAQHLLRTDTSVGRLRGRWHALGEQEIPLRVTYHPAYLLRSPEQKAKAWEDLTEARQRLDARRTPAIE